MKYAEIAEAGVKALIRIAVAMEEHIRQRKITEDPAPVHLDIECERCGLFPSTVSHRVNCSA